MDSSSSTKVSKDFLENLPEEICDNILNNLSVNELLNTSLVSTKWHKFIGRSDACMKKLKLKISAESLHGKNKTTLENILNNSKRNYVSLKFDKGMHSDDMREILLISDRKWKVISFRWPKFSSPHDFVDFIALFEAFIQKLKIEGIVFKIKDRNAPQARPTPLKKQLTFPSLRILDVHNCDSIFKMFQDVTTLKEFNISIFNSSSIKAIEKIFRGNNNLKKLSIDGKAFEQLFKKDISDGILFKLTSLRIGKTCENDSRINVNHFLELHTNTLNSLLADDWLGLKTVEMVYRMPRLKHFSLKGILYSEWKLSNFLPNESLTSLELLDCSRSPFMLKSFISATPNLKRLKLYSVNEWELICMSKLTPQLKSLEVTMFKVEDRHIPREILPNLEDLSISTDISGIKTLQIMLTLIGL